MLSEKEKDFITHWEKEREKHNSIPARIVSGLPIAFLFIVPVLLLITVVYFFLPEWYTRISNSISGSMITILIALIICSIFIAYFRMQYKWEVNEQYYKELQNKAQKAEPQTNNQ